MNWTIVVVLILNVTVIFIDIVAMVLLITVKQNNVKRSQKILLIAMCLTELTYAVLNIFQQLCYFTNVRNVGKIFLIFNFVSIFFMYIFIMVLITMDRFLEIYLNIKYRLLWSPQKTKIVLVIALGISLFLLIPAFLFETKDVIHFGTLFIYPTTEILFIIVTSVAYFYITKQVLRYRRNSKRLKQQLQRNNAVIYHKKPSDQFKIILPTLIILTFLCFMVVPNTIALFAFLDILPPNHGEIVYIFYPIGFVVDAIIYIFHLRSLRSAFKRMISRRKLQHPNNHIYAF